MLIDIAEIGTEFIIGHRRATHIAAGGEDQQIRIGGQRFFGFILRQHFRGGAFFVFIGFIDIAGDLSSAGGENRVGKKEQKQ